MRREKKKERRKFYLSHDTKSPILVIVEEFITI
jgi:hypothetical protein